MAGLLSPINHLLELARCAQRPTKIWLAMLLGTFGIGILLIIGSILAGVFQLQQLPEDTVSAAVSGLRGMAELAVTFAPILLFFWLWLRFFERRPFPTIGFERTGAAWHYGRGLLVGLGMFSAVVGLMAAFGGLQWQQGPAGYQGIGAIGGVLAVLLGWGVQGAAEEVMSRGFLLQAIGSQSKPWIGVVVSALVFGLLHSLNPGIGLLPVLNLFLFGVFAAFYALYEGGLWGMCAIHSIWNWTQGNLFGLSVSGTEAPGGTLLNLQSNGATLLTGGKFGPEGSLPVTIVLLACIGMVLFAARRRPAHA